MSGAAPMPATLATQRLLLSAARALDGPWGATLELCILTLCLPWEAVSIDLERINWSNGFVPVPARGGSERILALSREAKKAILRIAGEAGGKGQAVTAGRGRRFEAKLFRMDRLLDRLAEAAPETIALPEWNMHGLRLAAAGEMRADGALAAEIDAAIGRSTERGARRLRGDLRLAEVGAERWCRLLFADRHGGRIVGGD